MPVLYNKNHPLVEIEFENGVITALGKVHDVEHLPFSLQKDLTLDSINEWLAKRKIPEQREGLAEVRQKFRGFEKYRCMFSLSDQYWIRHNKNQTWANGNFFTNRYQSEVGNMFLSPYLVNRKRIGIESPDLTTNGVLKKKWVQDENMDSWLYKAGSRTFHQEPIAEVMASITLQKLNIIDYVPYELVIEGMQFCSKCKNFINENEEFVPAKQIYAQESRNPATTTVYAHLVRMCELYEVPDAREKIDAMLMADYVLCNTDRHLGNFGFIRDVETGKIARFAPLFDNGSVYRFSKPKKDREDLFKSENGRIKKLIKNHIPASVLRDTGDIYELLDTYPLVSQKRKDEIRHAVYQMQNNIDKMKGKNLPEVEFTR